MPNMTSTVYMTKSDLEKCEDDDEEDRSNSGQTQYDDNLHLCTLSWSRSVIMMTNIRTNEK